MTVAGGRLHFLTAEGADGFRLWHSDGTDAGTRLLVGAYDWPWSAAAPVYSIKMMLEKSGSELFIWRAHLSYDEGNRSYCELLHVNSTTGAASIVTSLYNVRNSTDDYSPINYECAPRVKFKSFLRILDLAHLGQRLFFSQTDEAHGTEPWILGTDNQPPFAYTLRTYVQGQGAIRLEPQQAVYAPGSAVVLTAEPAAGWRFSGWQGGATGQSSSTTITMMRGTAVTARFEQGIRLYLPLVVAE